MSKSIMQEKKECYLCRKFYDIAMEVGLERHHVMGGYANRKLSEKDGLVVWLCQMHHNTAPSGVHFNSNNMEILRQDGQVAWEKKFGTRKDFLSRYGKNYL